MTPTIKFVRSDCPDPYNGPGYNVWSDQYTTYFNYCGFVSNKNLEGIKSYFLSEGYYVKVIEDSNHSSNLSMRSELNYAN